MGSTTNLLQRQHSTEDLKTITLLLGDGHFSYSASWVYNCNRSVDFNISAILLFTEAVDSVKEARRRTKEFTLCRERAVERRFDDIRMFQQGCSGGHELRQALEAETRNPWLVQRLNEVYSEPTEQQEETQVEMRLEFGGSQHSSSPINECQSRSTLDSSFREEVQSEFDKNSSGTALPLKRERQDNEKLPNTSGK